MSTKAVKRGDIIPNLQDFGLEVRTELTSLEKAEIENSFIGITEARTTKELTEKYDELRKRAKASNSTGKIVIFSTSLLRSFTYLGGSMLEISFPCLVTAGGTLVGVYDLTPEVIGRYVRGVGELPSVTAKRKEVVLDISKLLDEKL